MVFPSFQDFQGKMELEKNGSAFGNWLIPQSSHVEMLLFYNMEVLKSEDSKKSGSRPQPFPASPHIGLCATITVEGWGSKIYPLTMLCSAFMAQLTMEEVG
jgi:hypothetical protein